MSSPLSEIIGRKPHGFRPPRFIAHSSGTLGGATKHFAEYRHPDHMSLSLETMRKSNPPTSNGGGRNCIMYSLGYS
ncbi:hypothetical protein EDD15DRAFT_2247442 [Pisolithus albus]|nr:hypothetical protein EDD15DRAFT_2247442 [Pisolithus albus]